MAKRRPKLKDLMIKPNGPSKRQSADEMMAIARAWHAALNRGSRPAS